jgi:hypothetical protein
VGVAAGAGGCVTGVGVVPPLSPLQAGRSRVNARGRDSFLMAVLLKKRQRPGTPERLGLR